MMALFLLILAGCGQQPPVEATESVQAPAAQAPATDPATVPTTEPAPEAQDAEILKDLGTCYLVKVEDRLGFMANSQISRQPIIFDNSGGEEESGGGNEWPDPVL